MLLIDVCGAVYPLTVDPLAQQVYLKASNTDDFDNFGASLAVSGDTVVVGAPGEDSSASGVDGDPFDNSEAQSGAVYVFVREAAGWSQQAYLKASNTESNDSFGWSLALSGETLVVGARHEDSAASGVGGDQSDNSSEDSGAVYVFVRNGSSWSQQAYLKASNTKKSAYFGDSVAVSGDTVVVGGFGGDGEFGYLAGTAYAFGRSGVTWAQEAYLKASNTEAGERFTRTADPRA